MSKQMKKESPRERQLRESIEEMRGRLIKFSPFVLRGFPDRIGLLPGGHVFFVELKADGRRIRPGSLQDYWQRTLKGMGFTYFEVYDETTFENCVTYASLIIQTNAL
jgi:hypothetical protein